MNTFQLSCFLAVADTLSFARAAERLNITQPAVTHQIRSLETELGAKLFKRTTRSVSLTYEGSIFMSDARSMLAIADRAMKRFSDPSVSEILPLHIGCHSFLLFFLLTDVLQRLAEEYPNISPRLRTITPSYPAAMLDDGDLDIVIGFRDVPHRRESTSYIELMTVPIVCICHVDNCLAKKDSVVISDLAGHKLILSDPIRVLPDVRKLNHELVAGRPVSEVYFSGSPEATAVLAAAGYGVGVMPELLLPPVPTITCVPFEDTDPLSFGIFCRQPSEEPVRSFIRLMRDECASLSSK